jgi:hypothetical protein
MQYTINYWSGDILGYQDIISPNQNNTRTETIDAVEDTFVLVLTKMQFT